MAQPCTEMHLLRTPDDYRRMPWKNGGGHTLEIASDPEGAGLDDFTWRVSVADVERSGSFSAFPGVDRTLVLMAGPGMRLSGAGEPVDLREPFSAARFAGEAAIDCALFDGPTRDFNLMVRRSRAHGEVVVVRGHAQPLAAASACVCYAATGACEWRYEGCAPVLVPHAHALVVHSTPQHPIAGVRVVPATPSDVALVALVSGIAVR